MEPSKPQLQESDQPEQLQELQVEAQMEVDQQPSLADKLNAIVLATDT